LFWQLDGFDERLFMYYEDDDLSLRARMAGYRCIAVPEAVVLHDHVRGISAAKLRYLERNRWWTMLKLFRWRTLAGLTPVLAGGEVMAWGMALRGGPWHVLAKLRGWAELLSWLPVLRRERQRVRRQVSDREVLAAHGARLPFRQVADGALARRAEDLAAAAFAGGRALADRFAVR
jgi:hypothetical protein